MTTKAANYPKTHFPHPDLTKINGTPTYASLHTIFMQLKANTMSVHSNLGGGRHGHLGLLLTPQQYALISPIPYIQPLYPPAPIYPQFLTQQQLTVITNGYKKALQIFHTVENVERALIQQIIEAIDETHLKAIKNRITGQLTGSIIDIITYLRMVYGRISPAQHIQLETEIQNLAYDPTTPIDTIFNAIEDLAEYADMANNEYSENQLISKAYNIINHTRVFRESIKE